MTTKHHRLYEYLLNRGDTWTTQVDVARDLFEHFGNGECCLAPEEYHDTTERLALSRAISDINFSNEFDKIIISSCKGIKLANEKEFDRYIKNNYKSALRKLARVYAMAKKGNRHNQIGIDGETVEAFLQKFPETT